MPSTLELGKAVAEARRRRYEEHSSDITEQEDPKHLLGECVRNAYVLSKVLDEFGIKHRVVCGGLNAHHLDEPPGTVSRTEEEGNIHYWCETLEEPRYIIDIASEVDEKDGRPLITQTLPWRYLYLVDGVDFEFSIVPHP